MLQNGGVKTYVRAGCILYCIVYYILNFCIFLVFHWSENSVNSHLQIQPRFTLTYDATRCSGSVGSDSAARLQTRAMPRAFNLLQLPGPAKL